ncbi:MAG: hypothetical protein WBB62_15660, partial [Rhodococcus sp. (in: high G+C Gram-positive bacteria)]
SRHAEHRHLTHHRPDFAVGHHAEPPPKIAGQAPISHKLRGIAPEMLADIAGKPLHARRERTCPRAVKRARHNGYRVMKRHEPASTRHTGPPTINLHRLSKTADQAA